MKAMDVMTTDVVTIGPQASVKDVAKLLLDKGISAVPVVDEARRVVGMVSEGDLVHRPEIQTERRRPWWLQAFVDNATLAEDYAKARGTKVRDVMTTPVISVEPGTTLGEVAALLDRHRIKRVPIVRDGVLVGVVSRADLLRAVAASAASPERLDSDHAIRTLILDKLKGQRWTALGERNVDVVDGVVRFWGGVGSEEEKRALQAVADSIEGVKRVEVHATVPPILPFGAAL
ncbi:CBS domain-containing protein [Arenibaculum pallidiluteum]|uniref:CBS domain-containing protein n=1 Tax=Arenibaculum pallidiluteum TaxID=2812559 RepID=UPI001A97B219|nr:CBS domain-containing protein [Arenibaculum pallidiluteum]